MTKYAFKESDKALILRKVTGVVIGLCLGVATPVHAQEDDGVNTAPDAIPDVREERLRVKLQDRNWFVVPIPVSNPTTDTGLVLAGAYFYPQTETQKKVQPPSVTGAAGYYSSNDSAAFGIAHQAYWNENKWRFGGVIAHVDLNLKLTAPTGAGAQAIDWGVEGELFAAIISRKISGKWYAGVLVRYLDIQQDFGVVFASGDFNTGAETVAGGVGLKLERDSRDKPINSYSGSILELTGVSNADAFGSDNSYTSYSASFASYHRIAAPVVLAWEVQGCYRSGEAPLWDACRVDLRGFSATDYLGRSSASGQVEARWQFHRKWGAVAFAGGGHYERSLNGDKEREVIPSYGIGLRYLVLESQRINMRLDYARSGGGDAFYLSVAEAF